MNGDRTITIDLTASAAGLDIVIVDDHPLLAHGLRAELTNRGYAVEIILPEPDRATDGQTVDADSTEVAATIAALRPRLVVLDLDLPVCGGGVALLKLLGPAPAPVVVLTGSDDRLALGRCLDAGAAAVLGKDEPLDDLIGAMGAILSGRSVRSARSARLRTEYRASTERDRIALAAFDELSPREADVLGGLMDGLSPAEVADRDHVAVATVRSQVKAVLRKLGVSSQLAAVARAHAARWDPSPATE